MDKDTKKYFLDSIAIIISCRELLAAYVALCIFEYSSILLPNNLLIVILLPSIALSFFLGPIAYGRFVEIINKVEPTSYSSIFKTHWINYYSVVLIFVAIFFPFIFIFHFVLVDHSAHSAKYIIEPLIGVISIYIFPLVFLFKERKRPIILGLKCILGNAGDSFYLILFVLFTYAIEHIYTNSGLLFGDLNKATLFFLGVIVGIISILANFMVFIIAAMILNNKLLKA